MRRVYAGVLVYLAGFALLLVIVLNYFLIPGLRAAEHGDHKEHLKLVAMSWLLLSVLLFYMFAGLMLAFRIGRFFFPRPRSPRVQTKYVDAWAEAAKRIDVPEEQQD